MSILCVSSPIFECSKCKILFQSEINVLPYNKFIKLDTKNGICEKCFNTNEYNNELEINKLISKIINEEDIFQKQYDSFYNNYLISWSKEITLEYCNNMNSECYRQSIGNREFTMKGFKKIKKRYAGYFVKENSKKNNKK